MRPFLILLLLAALAATTWDATTRGLGAPFFGGAPRIEALATEQVRTALGPDGASVSVIAAGRRVLLAGQAVSAEARDRMLAAAATVPIVSRVEDRLEVLPPADPFTLLVARTEDGASISGHVPGPAAGEALLAEARAVLGGEVAADLVPAGGAPQDWEAMVRAGLQALAPLPEGRLEIAGDDVSLTGSAPDPALRDAALAAAEGAPGRWQIAIARADALAFTAMKAPDGSLIIDGTAPDEGVRDALLLAVEAISAQPVIGTIGIAPGITPQGWEIMVGQGLRALSETAEGLITVRGPDGTLDATVAGDAARSAVQRLLGPGWTAKLTVVEIAGPDLTIEYDADGRFEADGNLPPGLAPQVVGTMLPGLDVSALGRGGGEADMPAAELIAWEKALAGLSAVLPRFREATVRLSSERLGLSGTLLPGMDVGAAHAELVAALEPGWELALDVAGTAPLAELVLVKMPDATVLSGLTPEGLEPDEATAVLDATAGEVLAAGGAGDASGWAQALAAMTEVMELFETAEARITAKRVQLSGVLEDGQDDAKVQAMLSAAIPSGWQASVQTSVEAGEEASVQSGADAPDGGDRRTNPDTGEAEILRNGFWLPELDFPVSPERCKAEADGALENGQVRFVTGSAEIDDEGRALIDRLAAIAVRCLGGSGLRLEISGHTDSVGNDAANQALSEARAAAVREALVARGVDEAALTAVGHGETQPVATNDTPEGRARNRRIAFDWSKS